MQNSLDTPANDSELRATARWAASVTLLLGQLLPDDFDLTRLVGDQYRRSFYLSRLSTETVALVNALSNFVLGESVRTLEIASMTTAEQLIDAIASHLTQKTVVVRDHFAAALPLEECEPDDTVGAI
jgi:hypothetical protein